MENEMNCQATNTTYTRLTATGFNQQVFLLKLAKAYDTCPQALRLTGLQRIY